MTIFIDANCGWAAALLPVAAGLLLEELTYGGLVRLLLAPWPETGRKRERNKKSGEPGCVPENRRR